MTSFSMAEAAILANFYSGQILKHWNGMEANDKRIAATGNGHV